MEFLQDRFNFLARFDAVIQNKVQLRNPPQRQPVADFMAQKSRR